MRHRRRPGRLGARERRVRVAEDHRPVGALPLDDRGDRPAHLVDVGRPQVEPVGGLREAQLLEEHLREHAVVVLPRVDDDLLDPGLAKGQREGRRLHELGPVPDDREDAHGWLH